MENALKQTLCICHNHSHTRTFFYVNYYLRNYKTKLKCGPMRKLYFAHLLNSPFAIAYSPFFVFFFAAPQYFHALANRNSIIG